MSTYATYSGASGGGGGGSVGGSGASPQVAVWSSANNISGSSGLTYASGNLTIGTTTPALNLTSTSALGSGMQGFVTFNDSAGLVSYLGYSASNDSKLRLSFSGGGATTNSTKAFILNLGGFNGDFWVLPTEAYTTTGNLTSGSAVIASVSSAVTAKLVAGMRVLTNVILSDVVSAVDDATHFTITTGSASYPTGGGEIVDQDTGTTLTYSAYNAGTKQMTVASTTGMLAGDTTKAYIGIPFYATISSVGATSITMNTNATSSVTGISLSLGHAHIGNITFATPGSRNGADDAPLNIYYSTNLSNPQTGCLFLHNNDPYHTAGRTVGITAFNDAPLTTRGAGPAGCPIGAINFYVEDDTARASGVGAGNFKAFVGNGTTYLNFLASDHSGNVSAPISLGVGAAAVTSSLLSVTSTTKGFLPPVMTATQRGNVATPATGLQVFDSTEVAPYFYTGAAWIKVGTKQVAIGTPATSNSAAYTTTSFGTPTVTPTVSFTATYTGTYEIFVLPELICSGTAGHAIRLRITATTGSPTVLFSQEFECDVGAYGANRTFQCYVSQLVTLTSGTAYVFELQALVAAGGDSLTLLNSAPTNGVAMVARQLS